MDGCIDEGQTLTYQTDKERSNDHTHKTELSQRLTPTKEHDWTIVSKHEFNQQKNIGETM
jgi:hypothetical protein